MPVKEALSIKAIKVMKTVTRKELLQAYKEKRPAKDTTKIIGPSEISESDINALAKAIYLDMKRKFEGAGQS